jgi:SAM-dependent methyltransferase
MAPSTLNSNSKSGRGTGEGHLRGGLSLFWSSPFESGLPIARAQFRTRFAKSRNQPINTSNTLSFGNGTGIAPNRLGDFTHEEVALENIMRSLAPGEGLKTQKMPGHWVLARLGKRVLRPGGMQLTRRLLEALRIQSSDDVVEFAPGMGVTARLTLAVGPASYTAIERDEAAAKIVESYLKGANQRCVIGDAATTGLPDKYASVVYGEAMLTMQTEDVKRRIVREAYRLLKSGGRYGIHEMCLMSDNLGEKAKKETEKALTSVVHHGVRPLTISQWRALLMSEGFVVQTVDTAPMSLLEPGRLIRDEGVAGSVRFLINLIRDSEARQRVLEMRSVFRSQRKQLGAVCVTTIKR